jgi:hypothetical protein
MRKMKNKPLNQDLFVDALGIVKLFSILKLFLLKKYWTLICPIIKN